MREVEPKVFLLAETGMNWNGMWGFLGHLGAQDWYREHPNFARIGNSPKNYDYHAAEFLIELAGRSCYKSFGTKLNPNLTKVRKDPKEYLGNILKSGHGSVLEHSWSTWAFVDCSRVMTHELVRHRVGTAFSQESLRYVRPTDIKIWIPSELEDVTPDLQANAVGVEELYKKLTKELGLDEEKSFKRKKEITSALRRILPIGMATNIIFSCNMRALRWILEMRTSPHAEVEIRTVFGQVGEIATKRWPFLFADFERVELEDSTIQWKPKYSKV